MNGILRENNIRVLSARNTLAFGLFLDLGDFAHATVDGHRTEKLIVLYAFVEYGRTKTAGSEGPHFVASKGGVHKFTEFGMSRTNAHIRVSLRLEHFVFVFSCHYFFFDPSIRLHVRSAFFKDRMFRMDSDLGVRVKCSRLLFPGAKLCKVRGGIFHHGAVPPHVSARTCDHTRDTVLLRWLANSRSNASGQAAVKAIHHRLRSDTRLVLLERSTHPRGFPTSTDAGRCKCVVNWMAPSESGGMVASTLRRATRGGEFYLKK